MTFTHGRKARLYFSGLNLSSFLNNADLDNERDVAETSVWTDEAKTYVSGQRDARASVSGVFNGDASSQDENIKAAFVGVGGDVFTYLPQGDGFGKIARCWLADETTYRISTPVNEAARWDMDAQVTGGTEFGRVLEELQAEAIAENGTTYDWGAAAPTVYGGAGYLQVVGAGPVAAFTVTIEHSSTGLGGSWTAVATFDAATDKTAQRVAIASGVNSLKRYTRYTVDGSTGGLKISVVICRKYA